MNINHHLGGMINELGAKVWLSTKMTGWVIKFASKKLDHLGVDLVAVKIDMETLTQEKKYFQIKSSEMGAAKVHKTHYNGEKITILIPEGEEWTTV